MLQWDKDCVPKQIQCAAPRTVLFLTYGNCFYWHDRIQLGVVFHGEKRLSQVLWFPPDAG